MTKRLSKSKLIAYRQCPKRLWLEIHRRELRDDSGAEAVFRTGHEVGEVARQVYDPEGSGTLIDVNELGYDEAFRRSLFLLGTGEGPVFEAGLQIDGALAFSDVMIPTVDNGGRRGWKMLEVKSTSSVKDYHWDDLAVQVHLADQMGVPLVSAGIAHIDTNFVYQGDGDYRGLFHEAELLDEEEFPRFEVEDWIHEAREVADLDKEPEIPVGPQCSAPFNCPFSDHCLRDKPQPEYPLSSLPNLNASRRAAIEAFGIVDLREAPDLLLTDTQKHVRDVTISGVTWIDADGAAAALAGHGFPAAFLDFETVMLAVPRWKNTRPYQQIPFQFSLHRITEEGSLSHDAFLDLSGDDPTRRLAEALLLVAGNEGPVYAYNAGFERRVLRELGQRYPDLAVLLTELINRVVDLLPIARAHFYDPSQHGSWSLKALLPAACPDLSYDLLEGVADGEMAVEAYREAISPETTQDRRQEIERQLLAYCEFDTLAMVRLWELFRG